MDRLLCRCRSRATRPCRVAFMAATLFPIAGCVSGHATYPEDWAPTAVPAPQAGVTAATAVAACPNIEGRYSNAGKLATTTPKELCEGAVSRKYRYIGDWLCETTLVLNIAAVDKTSFATILLRQPDDDTLQVVSGDNAIVLKEFHRSKGDFDCKPEGLVRRLNASVMSSGEEAGDETTFVKGYNAVGAAMNLLLASGGLQSLTRTFTKAADGSLVMTVERSTHGLIAGLPYGYEYSTYVTWPTAESQPASEPTSTLLPFKSWAMAPPWLVAIDDREYGLRPVDVVPGLHWVEFYAFNVNKPHYGAMFALEAGHTYQLAEPPPECLPAQGAEGHDTLGQLQWRDVPVNDTVADRVIATHTVRMMCAVGAHRCEADSECDSAERCLHYPGGGWGYCAVTSPPQVEPGDLRH